MSEGLHFESYISIPEGTEIAHDLLPADGKVALQLGAVFGISDQSLLCLTFDDPETLTKLIKVALSARAALMTSLGKQLTQGDVSDAVLLPAGSGQSTEVFATFEEISGSPSTRK